MSAKVVDQLLFPAPFVFMSRVYGLDNLRFFSARKHAFGALPELAYEEDETIISSAYSYGVPGLAVATCRTRPS